MICRRLFLPLLILVLAEKVLADDLVKIEPSQAYQTIVGWGTSLAWWANVAGGFPSTQRQHIVDLIFDRKTGLGLNIVRYNIGGGENPLYLAPNHQFLSLRACIPGYEPSPGVWDWKADSNQRCILKMAIKDGANIVQAFSNSPPYWMTISGSVTGALDSGNNLSPKFYDAFSYYLARVVKHFHNHWGITFESVEPFNEPNTNYWHFGGSQEGCHFDCALQNILIKKLGMALQLEGSACTPIAASDATNVFSAVHTFQSYDSATLKAISQIDTHTYWGGGRRKLYELSKTAGKPLWMSETGEGDASGLSLSQRALKDMNVMHAVAWVYWQAVDGGGWGLLSSKEDSYSDTEFSFNKKYYVFANYTRFIRPGFQILGSNDPESLVAYSSKRHTLVIVTTNPGNSQKLVTLDLSGFGSSGGIGELYSTSPDRNLQSMPDLHSIHKSFSYLASEKSVNTMVIKGVSVR